MVLALNRWLQEMKMNDLKKIICRGLKLSLKSWQSYQRRGYTLFNDIYNREKDES